MKNRDLLIKEWIDRAIEDELSAHAVLKEGAPSTGCFLSQQMAEKYLKGYLRSFDIDIPKIHDLLVLESQLQKYDKTINDIHEQLVYLNNYYIATRYPGDFPILVKDECQEALENALSVKDYILDKIEKEK